MNEWLWFLPAYLAIGALAGVLAGLLGVGGGQVLVPFLLLMFGIQGLPDERLMHLAVGTSLAAIVLTSVSSIHAHHRRGAVLWRTVIDLAPGLVIGALLGSVIADHLSSMILQRVFGVFLLALSAQMLLARMPLDTAIYGRAQLTGAGLGIGTVSALVGIGGGALTVPFLVRSFVPINLAVATSAACGFPIAVAGASGFLVAGLDDPVQVTGAVGHLYLPALIGIVSMSVLTAPLGAGLTHRLPVAHLKRVFALFLAAVGVLMLLTH